ncbi:TPA: hypothetical protein HA316_05155 [Candidatus Micrarchaeota archaeon]|nr:hypothetical protein [Candidatus Micrarchaeota archaeon]
MGNGQFALTTPTAVNGRQAQLDLRHRVAGGVRRAGHHIVAEENGPFVNALMKSGGASAFAALVDGNEQFVKNTPPESIAAYDARAPEAVFVTCSDSWASMPIATQRTPNNSNVLFIRTGIAGPVIGDVVADSIARAHEDYPKAIFGVVSAPSKGPVTHEDMLLTEQISELVGRQAHLAHYDIATGRLKFLLSDSETDMPVGDREAIQRLTTDLKTGDDLFVASIAESNELQAHMDRIAADRQTPQVTVVSDCRLTPELLFAQGVQGGLFVVSYRFDAYLAYSKSPTYIPDNAIIGSAEYGILHLETPLTVVLGETQEQAARMAAGLVEDSPAIFEAVLQRGKTTVVAGEYTGNGKVNFFSWIEPLSEFLSGSGPDAPTYDLRAPGCSEPLGGQPTKQPPKPELTEYEIVETLITYPLHKL